MARTPAAILGHEVTVEKPHRRVIKYFLISDNGCLFTTTELGELGDSDFLSSPHVAFQSTHPSIHPSTHPPTHSFILIIRNVY